MNANNPEFKKHHTQKTYTIQQYRPIYSVNYNITVINDDVVSNIARVLFDNGKLLEINGLDHGINFIKMEAAELKQTVDKIVAPLIEAEQEKLWQETGLDTYPHVYPIQGSSLPYFILDKNEYGRFGYCPLAPEKFAVLIHNDFGKPFMGLDNRMFGIYDNQLSNLLIKESVLDSAKIVDSLKELEPIAVRNFEEAYILQKLEQIRLETGARPFVFYSSGLPELVSLPAEAADYLTPEEMKLAEELISRQEQPEQEEILDETDDPVAAEEQDFEEELEERFEPEMCM